MHTPSTPIPLIVVEEHHEAFYFWHYAVQQGWLRPSGNTLLHVDAHSDMVLPVLRQPFPEGASLYEMARFTYEELDIATFILPAVYQRLFNRVLYSRYQHPATSTGWRRLSVAMKPDSDQEFVLTTHTGSLFERPAPWTRRFDYARITPKTPVDTDQPIVLDIDLDYFCSNESPHPACNEFETTEEAYEDFHHNPYCLLRLIPRLKTSAIVRDGRYFLVFYDDAASALPLDEEEAEISRRMGDFIAGLQTSAVRPAVISLCRSHHSGYTPARWVNAIQALLIERLQSLYPLQQVRLDDLLPANSYGRSGRSREACAS